MTPERFGSFCNLLRSAAVFVALFVCAAKASAEPVTLRAIDSDFVLQGEVLGFDGLHLRIATDHGHLTLNYASVTCEGLSCPDPGADAPIVRFSGAARQGEVILPALTEGFARSEGLRAERFDLDGRTLAYVLRDLADRATLTLVFRATTTADGFADLLAEETDVLMSNRVLTRAELVMAEEAGLGRLDDLGQIRLLGLDALVPVASPSQTVRRVTLAELAGAMRGELTNWQQLGGSDLGIEVHVVDAQNGAAQGFVTDVLEGGIAADAVVFPTPGRMAEAMLDRRGAIGVTALSDVGNLQVLDLRDACGNAAVFTADAIRTEDYPLTYPLFLIQSRRYMPPIAERFLDWTAGPEGQVILRRAGVETQEMVPISIQQQGQRLAGAIAAAGEDVNLGDLQEMMGFLQGRARLSLTFRFDEAARELDLSSRLHARYLARVLAEGRYRGEVLTLVGFSDGEGAASVNRILSIERAEAVRAAVVEILGGTLPEGTTVGTAGFGEALPVGCDDTEWGRRANRRVELWLGASQ